MHRQPRLGPRRQSPVPRGRPARGDRDALSGTEHRELEDGAARHGSCNWTSTPPCRVGTTRCRPRWWATRSCRPQPCWRSSTASTHRRSWRSPCGPTRVAAATQVGPGAAAGHARAAGRPPRRIGPLPRSRHRRREGLDHPRLHVGQPAVAGAGDPAPRSCRTVSRSGSGCPMQSAPPSARSCRRSCFSSETAAFCSRRPSSRPSRRRSLPIVVLVFVDGGYGILRNIQESQYGPREGRIGVDLGRPDFCGLGGGVRDPGRARRVDRRLRDGGQAGARGPRGPAWWRSTSTRSAR